MSIPPYHTDNKEWRKYDHIKNGKIHVCPKWHQHWLCTHAAKVPPLPPIFHEKWRLELTTSQERVGNWYDIWKPFHPTPI